METPQLDTAVILAGGLGTRLRPLTDTTPKPLLPIQGKPIVRHIIDNLVRHGVTHIILSIGYKAEVIQKFFADHPVPGVTITYSIEHEPLGTGGAIRMAAQGQRNPFIALNGDNLADFDYHKMFAQHTKHHAQITIALFPVEDVTKYGIAELSGDKIIRFIEKPSVEEAPSNLNNAGAYIIEPKALSTLPHGACSIERDCFTILAPKGVIYAYRHTGQWFPTDDMEKYQKAEKLWKPLTI